MLVQTDFQVLRRVAAALALAVESTQFDIDESGFSENYEQPSSEEMLAALQAAAAEVDMAIKSAESDQRELLIQKLLATAPAEATQRKLVVELARRVPFETLEVEFFQITGRRADQVQVGQMAAPPVRATVGVQSTPVESQGVRDTLRSEVNEPNRPLAGSQAASPLNVAAAAASVAALPQPIRVSGLGYSRGNSVQDPDEGVYRPIREGVAVTGARIQPCRPEPVAPAPANNVSGERWNSTDENLD